VTLLTAWLLMALALTALYAARQVKPARQEDDVRRAQRQSSQPDVIVTGEPALIGPQLFDLLIRNVEKLPAIRVSISLDPPPIRASEPPGFESAKLKQSLVGRVLRCKIPSLNRSLGTAS
jgi:hypothetical protein